MKIRLAFLVMLVNLASLALAQKKETYIVNPGQKPVETIPDSAQYAYPSFTKGNISFRDGRSSGTARMNYNYLFEEMMFLNPKGDTLAIDEAALVRQIIINTDTFYFSDVFIKQKANYGDIKLGYREYFRVANIRKIGAMGQATSNTVESYNAANTASDIRSLVVQEVVNLEKTHQFYLGDKFNNFQLANRKNLLALFPDKSKQVKAFLKENNINFTQESDLIKLLVYLKGN